MWAEDDRPREKMLNKGARSLSDAELLALILRSGSARQSAVEMAAHLLHRYNQQLDQLAQVDLHDLMAIPGIGLSKASGILAALELGKRRYHIEKREIPLIKTSRDAYLLVRPHLEELKHEEFWVIYLNRGNRCIDIYQHSKGGMTGTVVDTKLLLNQSVKLLASAIILAHNHPSGQLKPSDHDLQLTRKIREAATLFDVSVIDHIIVAGDDYFSFADQGLL